MPMIMSVVQGKKIFSTAAESIESWKVWGSLDDIVMGERERERERGSHQGQLPASDEPACP